MLHIGVGCINPCPTEFHIMIQDDHGGIVCVLNCPLTGYFVKNGYCTLCDHRCSKCFGENFDECDECIPEFAVFVTPSTCLSLCPLQSRPYLLVDSSSQECSSTIPEGYFLDLNAPLQLDGKLLQSNIYIYIYNYLECASGCTSCFGSSILKCLSCKSYLFMIPDQNKCSFFCPTIKYYPDIISSPKQCVRMY